MNHQDWIIPNVILSPSVMENSLLILAVVCVSIVIAFDVRASLQATNSV